MPKGPMSPAVRKLQSRRMKARWAAVRAKDTTSAAETNGQLSVTTHITLRVHDTDVRLTVAQAQELMDALRAVLPSAVTNALPGDVWPKEA